MLGGKAAWGVPQDLEPDLTSVTVRKDAALNLGCLAIPFKPSSFYYWEALMRGGFSGAHHHGKAAFPGRIFLPNTKILFTGNEHKERMGRLPRLGPYSQGGGWVSLVPGPPAPSSSPDSWQA